VSKIGNYLIELQSSEDFQFGWESAERGEPKPDWGPLPTKSNRSLNEQQLGWAAWHAAETAQ
jgi:hypothetical protein